MFEAALDEFYYFIKSGSESFRKSELIGSVVFQKIRGYYIDSAVLLFHTNLQLVIDDAL